MGGEYLERSVAENSPCGSLSAVCGASGQTFLNTNGETMRQMFKKSRVVAIATGLLVAAVAGFGFAGALPLPSQAAEVPPSTTPPISLFLKIDGIQGEATTVGHENEINVDSFNWGDNTGGGVVTAAGKKVQVNDLHFTMKVNKASPKLMQACATGEHFPTVVLTTRRNADTQDYYKITMSDVVVSSYTTSAATSDPSPTEGISLNFGSVKVEYQAQNPNGGLGDVISGSVASGKLTAR